MILWLNPKSPQAKNVPSIKLLLLHNIIFLLSLLSNLSTLEVSTSNPSVRLETNDHHHLKQYVEPSSDLFGGSELRFSNFRIPTPPLDLDFALPLSEHGIDQENNSAISPIFENTVFNAKLILPTRVFEDKLHSKNKLYDNLLSPNYKYLSSSIDFNGIFYNNLFQQNVNPMVKADSYADTGNNFDLIESGSGVSNWDGNTFDESSSILDDSTTLKDPDMLQPTGIQPTPKLTPEFGPMATVGSNDNYNQAPVLQRRLPKLVATAGQVWKFYMPPETFLDEDGDLRQLNSSVIPTMTTKISNKISSTDYERDRDSIGQFNSWLQYDQQNQLLYGFPTESELGTHEYLLVVSDRMGLINNETIEIHVRQHQSARAFTHLVVMNRVEWNWQKYSSFVDALGEFVRRMTTQVFNDQPFKNFIAQYYVIDSSQNMTTPTRETSSNLLAAPGQLGSSSFTIAWSNSSIPIYPCNLSYIDNLSRELMDIQKQINSGPDGPATFEPSRNLIQALDYEFKPTSISIFLQGACENQDSLQANKIQDYDNDGPLRTRIKIGRMNFKLGEPIEFTIPVETFELGKVSVTRELQLSVHTIDGTTLDANVRYNFLEFDQDTQTLYGMPYDFVDHTGQREIQLTGRHAKTGQKVREVFVIDVEAQDLTAINNRAFKMSLYIGTRTGLFGPKARVDLSHRMSDALHFDEGGYRNAQEKPEFIVAEIQKFAFGSQYDNRGNDVFSKIGQGSAITRVSDNSSYLPDDLLRTQDTFTDHTTYSRTNYLYKYIWTDSTIGHRGDCPVEVIKESILYALERSMLEHRFNDQTTLDDPSKNDSVKFYNRLRRYFEPDLDLIHLRFEPINACLNALELHDVGNSDLADQVDKASDSIMEAEQVYTAPSPPLVTPGTKTSSEINSDEYWSIIVLIVLVVALIFVILMFVMGMHTYKINQDKRFELQVRLAQARQNSMFLSSMILADHTAANDLNTSMLQPPVAKSMYALQDEDKVARKPVILENEKQILVGASGNNQALNSHRPSAVQLSGGAIQTTTMRPNMTFTLDSIAGWQQQPIALPSYNQPIMMQAFIDEGQRSMTLHRPSNTIQHAPTGNGLNHSQSILTVASIATPVHTIQQTNVPLLNYGHVQHPGELMQSNYASLPRRLSQQRFNGTSPLTSNGFTPFNNVNYVNPVNGNLPRNKISYTQKSSPKLDRHNDRNGPANRLRSPSLSTSNSETPQSVISNPNYSPAGGHIIPE